MTEELRDLIRLRMPKTMPFGAKVQKLPTARSGSIQGRWETQVKL